MRQNGLTKWPILNVAFTLLPQFAYTRSPFVKRDGAAGRVFALYPFSPICIEYGVMMRFFRACVRPSTFATSQKVVRSTMPAARALAISGVCAFVVAGCMSTSSDNGGGGDGINDAALGVAASPRVTDQETNLPRGGGRAQVGRPYRIGGQLYTPRVDDDYDEVGIASWYGRAFHGRLTANGEVYDMHTLSAAHPTLPLPSYVRVTNTENNHSVVVRVNDRGPFSRNRIIDLSQRAADVLDFRHDGVARVRVQYIEQARLDGQDVEWLEASAQINGVPVGGAGNTLFASAAPRDPVPAPIAAPNQTAFVATSDVAPTAQVRSEPARAGFLESLFGTQQAPQPAFQRTPQPAAQPAFVPANGAPIDLSPPTAALSQPAYVAPTFAPAPAGLVPNAPIPSVAIGYDAISLSDGFTQRNQSALAQRTRIEMAHRQASLSALDAASQLALQSQTLASRRDAQLVTGSIVPAGTQTALVQIGIFGDPANVARLERELSRHGQVVTQQIQSGGRSLTQVRLQAPVSGPQAAQALLRQLASEGYTDAYLTEAANS